MRRGRGFTLIEMMVVVALIGIAATMTIFYFTRQGPRARLDSTALEVRTLIVSARQEALATGQPIVLMVFPRRVTPGEGVGRFVMVADPGNTLFSAASAVSFGDYDDAAPVAPDGGELLEVFDLPRPVVIGPAAGLSPDPLPAPLALDVDKDCAFCDTGGDRRGAIRFDPSGKATFYAGDGAPLPLPLGSSLFVTVDDLDDGVRGFGIAAATGAVQSLTNLR